MLDHDALGRRRDRRRQDRNVFAGSPHALLGIPFRLRLPPPARGHDCLDPEPGIANVAEAAAEPRNGQLGSRGAYAVGVR
jgi:hypothetical protein